MTLATDILTSPNLCSGLTTWFDEAINLFGGGARVMATIYLLIFVVPLAINLGVGKNMFYGLIGAFMGHTILLILLNTNCLTTTTDYLAFAWVFEIVLIGLFAVIYIKRNE